MRLLAVIPALSAGCFYIAPVNQRPALEIQQRPSPDGDLFVHRGDRHVVFDAVVDDPDGDVVELGWRAYACDDGNDFATCDAVPFATGELPAFDLVEIPTGREAGTPLRSLRIELEGKDEYGATARPSQVAAVPVRDAPPDVFVFDQKPYDGVVGTPIDLFFDYGDADDTAANVTLAIEVTPPGLADATLTELANVPQPDDPDRRQIGRRLVPTLTGAWKIDVTATSPAGEVSKTPYVVEVIADLPPCLAQLSPAVPPPDATLPLSEPTLFQVLQVDDALDRFPTIAGDPFLGPTTFAWSLRRDDNTRELLAGATGNAIELDPASFTPGEQVELRVEVFDRNATPITCADEAPSCSVIATACVQRQTWLVEVR